MRTHVSKTVSNCFAALRQIRSRPIRQCVSRQVMLSMVVSLVLQRLDFGNATLVGLPAYHQLSRLQSVLNAAARLVFSRSKYDHVTPLFQELRAAAIATVSLLLVYWCRAACLHRAPRMSNRSIRAHCVNNVWRTAAKKDAPGYFDVFFVRMASKVSGIGLNGMARMYRLFLLSVLCRLCGWLAWTH